MIQALLKLCKRLDLKAAQNPVVMPLHKSLQAQEQMMQHEEFDPLEMDRHSQLQQLSRALFESASDLLDPGFVAAATIDRVVARPSNHRVRATAPGDAVAARAGGIGHSPTISRAGYHVSEGGSGHLLDLGKGQRCTAACGGACPSAGQRHRHTDRRAAQIQTVKVIAAFAAVDTVIRPSDENIAPVTAMP